MKYRFSKAKFIELAGGYAVSQWVDDCDGVVYDFPNDAPTHGVRYGKMNVISSQYVMSYGCSRFRELYIDKIFCIPMVSYTRQVRRLPK